MNIYKIVCQQKKQKQIFVGRAKLVNLQAENKFEHVTVTYKCKQFKFCKSKEEWTFANLINKTSEKNKMHNIPADE